MKVLSYSALLLGSLLLATSCEKASVAPEMAATISQAVAPVKDKAIEVRVTATLTDASGTRPFVATLRVDHFTTPGDAIFAKSSFGQVGGGLSRSDVQLVLAGNTAADPNGGYVVFPLVSSPSHTSTSLDITVGGRAYLTAGATIAFTGQFAADGTLIPVDSSPGVLLQVNQDTRNYSKVIASHLLTSVVNWYNGPTTIAELNSFLDGIADIIGRS